MDIEERNILLRVFWNSRSVQMALLICLFLCGFPYIRRVSLLENVCYVYREFCPMVNEWLCYWPCRYTRKGNRSRGECRGKKDDWSPPEVMESLACLIVEPLVVS